MSQDNLLHENMNLLHDCRSFSDLKTVTGCRVTETTLSLSEPSVNHALDLRSVQVLLITWRLLIDI